MTTFNIGDLFEATADHVPDRLALVAGDQRRTYRELDDRATRVANHLLGLGLEPGARIGVYSWNRAEWLEASLGALKAGFVPINVNYRYVAAELSYVFENADLEALVFERTFAPTVAEATTSAPLLRNFLVLEDGSDEVADFATPYEEALAAASPERTPVPRSADDLYFLYTGGTTGMPKGVIWRHEDLFYAALGGDRFGQGRVEKPEELLDFVSPDERVSVSLTMAPLMHGAANWTVYFHLLSGNTVVSFTGRTFDPDAILRLIQEQRCTNVGVVGDAMARPIAELIDRDPSAYDLSSLTVINSAGAIFSKVVKDLFRKNLPNLMIIDAFGSSEMGATSLQPDPEAGLRFRRDPLTDVLGDDLRPVEPGSGVVGKFARRGNLPLGYHKDEAKTAATFVTDPDGVRWVIAGDHATSDADGMITMLGRGSFCINTGGEKVYPEEVEAAVKSHPDVFDALVVGLPDERFGQKVAAVVQARPGRAPSLDDISTHCRTMVAGYKVPRHLTLVDAIGRTASGKGDYAWAKGVAESTGE